MSFKDRLYNTMGSGLYLMIKHLFMNPKWEKLIDELFPDDPRSQRPSISEKAGKVRRILVPLSCQ